ncbi:MAG TPA: XylR family transcriptional regulator [Caulifigura sp.]|nr:XylR family transcriptional regulator [Caulifigura sp.]
MHRYRVALLVETSQIYGRELHEGIADFFEAHGDWSLFMDQRELGAEPPKWFTHRQWDGVISRITTPALARAIRKMKVAAVDLTDRAKSQGFPRIQSDHRAIGAMAADHLLDRSFRSFAFCGYSGEAWSDGRLSGFRERLQSRGFDCEVFESAWSGSVAPSWDADEQSIGKWLKGLSRPVGLMACNDLRGQQVLESCRRLNVEVPREIAVIGVDNDRLICRLSDPPLSSVVPNARHVGYQAAALLDSLMKGGKAPAADQLIAPVRVVTRRSSDTLAVDDQDLEATLKFIQDHACRGITVADVLKSVPVSRSFLERRFREILGRTPHAQIRHVQLERAIELVTETELPLKQISLMCGISHVEYLSYLFKNHTGVAPGEYRRRHGEPTRRKVHSVSSSSE